jgi:vacuolar-type H+-ATPase subunit H
MTTPLTPDLPAALAPVRAALLARARRDAEDRLARADEDVAGQLADARAEAARITAEARAQGERDAAVVLSAERTRARRQARAVVLHAQRDAYEELRRRCRAAARGLVGGAGHRDRLDRLRAIARADLGAQALLEEHPDGGVTAAVPGRRAHYTPDALADLALDALGGQVQGLWTP